jgi:hypothetical protein
MPTSFRAPRNCLRTAPLTMPALNNAMASTVVDFVCPCFRSRFGERA